MTLIVGVKCTDGIALAADTRVAFGSAIMQDTAHKLDLIGNDVILGVAGLKSVAQEYLLELRKQFAPGHALPFRDVDGAKQFISNALSRRFKSMIDRIKDSPIAYGEDYSEYSHQTLVACVIPEALTTHLLYFDEQLVATEINDFYPIQAIGSGTEAALFFGTVIRRIVYRNQMPTVRQGLIGAYWIVDMAIKCNTDGVGGMIDCACLHVEDSTPKAWVLKSDELGEIREYLEANEERITELFREYPGSDRDALA